MTRKRGEYPPKAEWGPGEWQDEPDKVVWMTEAGYHALALRVEMGNWCGYVVLPSNHPWFGKQYSWCTEGCRAKKQEPWPEAIPQPSPGMLKRMRYLHLHDCGDYMHSPEGKLDVHGGVTYAGDPSHLRHIPPDFPRGKWWAFGFDCAHYMDRMPGMEAMMARIAPDLDQSHHEHDEYRTLEFVQQNCEDLAKQLREQHTLGGSGWKQLKEAEECS